MKPQYPLLLYLMTAAGAAGLIAVLGNPGAYEPYVEGNAYLQIAQGHPEMTYNYYAGRLLHPFVARGLARAFPMDLRHAFFAVAVISLLALFVSVSLQARQVNLHPAMLIPLLSVPAAVALYRAIYFQDLFHAALVAAFFLIYAYSAWAALPILFLLHLTRESTILLTVWVVGISLRRRRWAYALCAVVVAALGMAITSAALRTALPNKHGVNSAEMYALKALYAFCYNLLGLVFWTDTNASTINCAPRWTLNVAGHLGAIRQIGFCGFQPRLILVTLSGGLVPFGVEPGILARVMRERGRALLKLGSDFQTAFAYGATCLVLAPLTGPGPGRYFLCAWPLYWVVLPEMLKGFTFTRAITAALIALHAATCLLGFFLDSEAQWYEQLLIVMLSLVFNAAAYCSAPKVIPAGGLP